MARRGPIHGAARRAQTARLSQDPTVSGGAGLPRPPTMPQVAHRTRVDERQRVLGDKTLDSLLDLRPCAATGTREAFKDGKPYPAQTHGRGSAKNGAIFPHWPSENESVMSGKVAILPPEVESKIFVNGSTLHIVHIVFTRASTLCHKPCQYQRANG